MSRLGDAGVDLFLCDSTNAEIPGVGPSESEIGPTLHRLIRGASGRVIVACFASNVDRVQQIIDAATALGRRVSFVGRSMVRNMGIARDLGFLQVDDSDLVEIGAAEMMPPDQVVLITTGTQGEPMAALSRMSRGEHRSITLTSGDLIILSSSLIPGNEEAVYGVIDELAKIGARVVTNQQARVHVSGHAYSGELLFLYNGVRPRNVMPVHGTWRMLRANAKLAASAGVPEESIVVAENGVSVDLVGGRVSIAGAVPVGKMFVDGLITGDVGDTTLGERLILSSGFIAITVVVRRGTGKPAAAPHVSFARVLRRSQGVGAGGPPGRRRAGIAGRPERHRPGPDRAGSPAHGWQVGGGDLPSSADDRADRHRNLVGPLGAELHRFGDVCTEQIGERYQLAVGQDEVLTQRRHRGEVAAGVLVEKSDTVDVLVPKRDDPLVQRPCGVRDMETEST